MNTIYLNARVSDDERRRGLYDGQLYVYSETPSALKLCELARELVEAAFKGIDPLKVHERLPVEECVAILAELKPRFIHHPRAKECIQGILRELGCDLEKTYFDVPRLRTAFPADYLTSGIAYAFHPHRDTWYSAPYCQLNWWMPVYPITSENSMAFHPRYWNTPVLNSSRNYNYYLWNEQSRAVAAQ